MKSQIDRINSYLDSLKADEVISREGLVFSVGASASGDSGGTNHTCANEGISCASFTNYQRCTNLSPNCDESTNKDVCEVVTKKQKKVKGIAGGFNRACINGEPNDTIIYRVP